MKNLYKLTASEIREKIINKDAVNVYKFFI